MDLDFRCEYCDKITRAEATLLTGASQQLVARFCPNCYLSLVSVLEKVRSVKSWATLEQEIESLKNELKFLRSWDEGHLAESQQNEVINITTKDGQVFPAHRSMLIAKSEVFKSLLRNSDGRLMTDMEAESLLLFLHFLYTGEVSVENLGKHATKLMGAAHVYEIKSLKLKCEDYISKNMTEDTAIKFLEVAALCNSESIKLAAVKQIKQNFKTFFFREDYQTMKKINPLALAEAFEALAISTQMEDSCPNSTQDPLRHPVNSVPMVSDSSRSPNPLTLDAAAKLFPARSLVDASRPFFPSPNSTPQNTHHSHQSNEHWNVANSTPTFQMTPQVMGLTTPLNGNTIVQATSEWPTVSSFSFQNKINPFQTEKSSTQSASTLEQNKPQHATAIYSPSGLSLGQNKSETTPTTLNHFGFTFGQSKPHSTTPVFGVACGQSKPEKPSGTHTLLFGSPSEQSRAENSNARNASGWRVQCAGSTTDWRGVQLGEGQAARAGGSVVFGAPRTGATN